MRFTFRHLFVAGVITVSENDMPTWLTHRGFKWFLNDHVLMLEVGKSVKTDFHEITRVE